VYAYHCAQFSYTTQHRRVLIISDYLPDYPPDKHQSLDARCCLLEGRGTNHTDGSGANKRQDKTVGRYLWI